MHSVIMLLMDGISQKLVKINYASFCWGPPGNPTLRTSDTNMRLNTPVFHKLSM